MQQSHAINDSVTSLAFFKACGTCSYDLSQVPPSARYCPRCGTDVTSTDEPAPIPFAQRALDLDDADARLQVERLRPLAAGAIQRASQLACRSILTGYANALFRLGLRYESALGATRNVEEAARCYDKAARLTE